MSLTCTFRNKVEILKVSEPYETVPTRQFDKKPKTKQNTIRNLK